MQRGLAAVRAAQCGVFTAAQAHACGVSEDEIRALVRRGEWSIVRRGIYVVGTPSGLDATARHVLQVAAALLAYEMPFGEALAVPDSAGHAVGLVAGHHSAALLWGLPDVRAAAEKRAGDETIPDRRVELVSRDRLRRKSRGGSIVRPAALPDAQISVVAGLPVTSRARTAVDLARRLGEWEGVALTDAALRAGTPATELRAAASYCALWPGGLKASRAAAFADGKSESVAESRARFVLAHLGFPVPELQVSLGDDDGPAGRVDFYFRSQWTGVEVDGRVKYSAPTGPAADVLWKEKLREDRLRRAGIEIVRLVWADLGRPELVRRLVLEAFARAARARQRT